MGKAFFVAERLRAFVPEAQPEISLIRSVWCRGGMAPARIIHSSLVLSGRMPVRGLTRHWRVWLISTVAPRPPECPGNNLAHDKRPRTEKIHRRRKLSIRAAFGERGFVENRHFKSPTGRIICRRDTQMDFPHGNCDGVVDGAGCRHRLFLSRKIPVH
jgi:hypothetical protein